MRIMIFVVFFSMILIERDLSSNYIFDETKSAYIYKDTLVDNSNIHKYKSPVYPDIYYEYKIAHLNKLTPIELEYNETVRKYIDIYTRDRKKDFEQILGLTELYFPIFDEYLDKYNLPFELKYLAVLESGLNPLAKSKSGAFGIWQFKVGAAKMMGLQISSYIDERCDPIKSTEAACKYLQYLYRTFNDWQLAISAFNGGPGPIRNAIHRSGGKTSYNEIRNMLPEQTKNYFPAFVAALYVLNYSSDHNIKVVAPDLTYHDIDTVKVDYAISFQQISDAIQIPISVLKILNPVYIRDFVPDLETSNTLYLPVNKLESYIHMENRILTNQQENMDYHTTLENAACTENKEKIVYIVEQGDFFHKIAVKFNCTIENIKAWNDIKDDYLYPGQELIIWVIKED